MPLHMMHVTVSGWEACPLDEMLSDRAVTWTADKIPRGPAGSRVSHTEGTPDWDRARRNVLGLARTRFAVRVRDDAIPETIAFGDRLIIRPSKAPTETGFTALQGLWVLTAARGPGGPGDGSRGSSPRGRIALSIRSKLLYGREALRKPVRVTGEQVVFHLCRCLISPSLI
jgi:hypothetical protein